MITYTDYAIKTLNKEQQIQALQYAIALCNTCEAPEVTIDANILLHGQTVALFKTTSRLASPHVNSRIPFYQVTLEELRKL